MTPPRLASPSATARAAAAEGVALRMEAEGIDRVRIGWCDLHGMLRGKTLMAGAVPGAFANGIGMVGTLLLKDTSDRTAYRVFEQGGGDVPAGFGFAGNLMLVPDPASFRVLPWAERTGWLRAEAQFEDGTAVPFDTRHILQQALARLADAGYGLVCGLEVELHIYTLARPHDDPSLDPMLATWPGEPPEVAMIHPGYALLSEAWSDFAEAPLRIVQATCEGLGLPLTSLEIELGPSQVEAVFEPAEALLAADRMVLFRNGVKQALRRAGYHASFVCRPPFPNAMASGWHLHQSLVDIARGENAFSTAQPASGSTAHDAGQTLSTAGTHWLAGLLAHARGSAVFCAPTINAYARFAGATMAPQAVTWGRDNRGAMLRVLGHCASAATRIENRIGEPCANPYLYMAAQIHAGLDGLSRRLVPPRATTSPYGDGALRLPVSLGEALTALREDEALVRAFTPEVVDWLVRIKQSELARHDAATDSAAWQAREYFSRF